MEHNKHNKWSYDSNHDKWSTSYDSNHDKWSTTNTTNEDTMQVNFTHDDLLNDTQKILELSIAGVQ